MLNKIVFSKPQNLESVLATSVSKKGGLLNFRCS